MLFESKKINISNKVNQCNRDTRQLFKLVSEITSSTKDNPLPDRKSNQEPADQFVGYFINKIQKIRIILIAMIGIMWMKQNKYQPLENLSHLWRMK